MPYRSRPALLCSALLICLLTGCSDSDDASPDSATDAGADAAQHDADAGSDAGQDAADTAEDDESPFVGVWVTHDGSGTMTCDGVDVPLNSGMEGVIADDGGLVLQEAEGCEFNLDVDQNTASVAAGTTCEQTNDQETTQRTEIDTLTLTLTDDGAALEQEFEGRLVTEGQSESTCVIDFSGMLTRAE